MKKKYNKPEFLMIDILCSGGFMVASLSNVGTTGVIDIGSSDDPAETVDVLGKNSIWND
jgi:hypothetical protein